MKKLMLIVLCALLLTGCSSGVSQEEYESVVDENNSLESEIQALSNSKELEVKIAEYQARIEEQYSHANFVMYVAGQISDTNASEAISGFDDLYTTTSNTINAIKEVISTVNELDSSIDINEYISEIDDIYSSWKNAYDTIIEMENYLMNE